MKTKKIFMIGLTMIAGSVIILNSCKTIPHGINAVTPFDANRYLGKWYEIARFDFRFEKNLNNTTADYSLNSDNSIKVVNAGFNYKENKWKQAIGKAKFVKDRNTAMLKVSFFGPFYAGYNVVEIDENYKYALIMGESTKYLWLLSREKTMPKEIINKYVEKAKKLGCKTENLIWVEHNK